MDGLASTSNRTCESISVCRSTKQQVRPEVPRYTCAGPSATLTSRPFALRIHQTLTFIQVCALSAMLSMRRSMRTVQCGSYTFA
eukprot:8303190-Pyramimonas_sp.AAC.2